MNPNESRENRLKRLHMRSWRRGIKEMDLVLGKFSDDHLGDLSDDDLALYDALLSENDQDMLRWITGQDPVPAPYGDLFARISDHAHSRGTARS
ncbi:antitoxin CptB [Aliiruegeria haliotis]|uniref:FAD assembly factor SdhE n=1 Tax=Aliiruegeria haliotis TaxID=1280846 RepID=A0A2T0RWB4_9RHOB|nr:succinate dehydrogenase assembly factor 2 [Aliiruegeria haliotis]PRY25343.1 antitoxin CptB [Aliiruegeria haliotis]